MRRKLGVKGLYRYSLKVGKIPWYTNSIAVTPSENYVCLDLHLKGKEALRVEM